MEVPSDERLDRAGAMRQSWSAPPTAEDVRRIAAVDNPVVRNLQITQAYHDLSAAMARTTGAGANWCTVATWASRQAGQSIRREDLIDALERLLREGPAAQANAEAMLEASALIGGPQPESFFGALDALWNAVEPSAAFQRTSDAVARGNVKVFAEIGAEFARFLALFENGRAEVVGDSLAAFCEGLRPGDPPDGQRYLIQAFEHYAQAIAAADLQAESAAVAAGQSGDWLPRADASAGGDRRGHERAGGPSARIAPTPPGGARPRSRVAAALLAGQTRWDNWARCSRRGTGWRRRFNGPAGRSSPQP